MGYSQYSEVKDSLLEVVQCISVTDKTGKKWACPVCGSGKGKNGTSAFSITSDGKKWRCFSCEHGGDVLDLVGEVYGITDKVEQLKKVNEICGTDFSFKGNEASSSKAAAKSVSAQKQQEAEQDYTEYFARCAGRIGDTDYRRGISMATLTRFNIGFDPAWRHPKAPASVPTSPRLIIPTSKSSYLARDTRSNIPDNQKRYAKSKAGKINIFSLEDSAGTCFIVEGEIDAMSIIDCGGRAVGLGSVSNVGMFLEYIKAHRPQDGALFIVALDNDKQGNEAAAKLGAGLKALNIPFSRAGVLPGLAKDANEALMRNRQELKAWIKLQMDVARLSASSEVQEIDRPLTPEQYDLFCMADKILATGFASGIADSVNTPVISTGFEKLDSTLDGGLYEGLYVVGGVSSLGKTSYVMQIVDQVAAAGHDVVIFSLEMSKSELIAKSLSRLTMIISQEKGKTLTAAKTPRGITDGKRYANYTAKEKDLIQAACERYAGYANNISIREGVGNIGVMQIRDAVLQHISFRGKRPVVVVDYMQILAPMDIRATDKQNTDRAVLELKRLSRDLKIPVVCISSLNRASYSNKISMEAFKESGAIEYSSDVLLGLQFAGAGGDKFDIDKAKHGEGKYGEREIQCVVLKNRYGRTGGKITYTYNPCFNHFSEGGGYAFNGEPISKKESKSIGDILSEVM